MPEVQVMPTRNLSENAVLVVSYHRVMRNLLNKLLVEVSFVAFGSKWQFSDSLVAKQRKLGFGLKAIR